MHTDVGDPLIVEGPRSALAKPSELSWSIRVSEGRREAHKGMCGRYGGRTPLVDVGEGRRHGDGAGSLPPWSSRKGGYTSVSRAA